GANHPLVRHMAALRLALEEFDAAPGQGQGHLHAIVAQYQLLGRGRKSSTIRGSSISPSLCSAGPPVMDPLALTPPSRPRGAPAPRLSAAAPYTVRVTLLRPRGRSGSRPRAWARAAARG